MKPQLIIGLGNPLMGDDGIGWHMAARLSDDPRLPVSVEVVCGGSDLLRFTPQIEGRSRVFVIDAVRDDEEPGRIFWMDDIWTGLNDRQEHAHHLSVIQSIELSELLTSVPCTLIGVAISSARLDPGLSPALAAKMPVILDCVLGGLNRGAPVRLADPARQRGTRAFNLR